MALHRLLRRCQISLTSLELAYAILEEGMGGPPLLMMGSIQAGLGRNGYIVTPSSARMEAERFTQAFSGGS